VAVVAPELGLRRRRAAGARRSTWARFAVQRSLALAGTLLVLLVMTFAMVRLVPGDPAVAVGGLNADEQELNLIRDRLGLDEPVLEQFVRYAGDVVRGDLGRSFITETPVGDTIRQRLGVSARLAGLALLVVMVVSTTVGLVAGYLGRSAKHPRFDVGFTAGTSVFGTFPEFLLATLMAAVFGVWLTWLPVAGVNGWDGYVLPVGALAIRPTCTLARIVRLETMNVLGQEYLRTAESKRLPRRTIAVRHVLPNAVAPAITIGGLLFASLVAGTVLVESVFSLPGLGTVLVSSVKQHDYPLVQGIVMVLGVTVVVVNTAVDAILLVLDPRALTAEA
jgi:peptide/nickel transport system permease protein